MTRLVATTAQGTDPASPQVIADQWLGRLRAWPDIPSSIAREAGARWDSDHDLDSLRAWLDAVVAPFDVDSVIDCECGSVLIDASRWSGRAVVTCDGCGARFGVEVIGPEQWSMWALPTEPEASV